MDKNKRKSIVTGAPAVRNYVRFFCSIALALLPIVKAVCRLELKEYQPFWYISLGLSSLAWFAVLVLKVMENRRLMIIDRGVRLFWFVNFFVIAKQLESSILAAARGDQDYTTSPLLVADGAQLLFSAINLYYVFAGDNWKGPSKFTLRRTAQGRRDEYARLAGRQQQRVYERDVKERR